MLNLFRKKENTGSAFVQPGTQISPLARLFDKNEKEVSRIRPLVEKINALAPDLKALSDDDLKARSEALKAKFQERVTERLSRVKDTEGDALEWRELDSERDWSNDYARARRQAEDATLDELTPEAFALVREAGDRTIGLRHFDVQMIGGAVLHSGRIAEMRTGEGKTLVATAPAYLNALSGRGVHVITVNDYLAERDANWMRPIFEFLGMSVSALANEMPTEARQAAYSSDILYATNAEVGFDYLRDNMARESGETVQRSLNFAIVDEVDNILIDEARTPLIISAQVAKTERAQRRQQMAKTCDGLARRLVPGVTDREVEAMVDSYTTKGRLDTDGLLQAVLKRGAFQDATSYLIDAYLLAEKSARTENAAHLLDAAAEFYDAKLLDATGRQTLETLAVNAVRPEGVRAAWEQELAHSFAPFANAWISASESPDAATRAASLSWELALSDESSADLTAQLMQDEDADANAQTAQIIADEMMRRALIEDAGRDAVVQALLALPANADADAIGASLEELSLHSGALQEADSLLRGALEHAGNGDTPEAARELVAALEEVSRRGLLPFESIEALWQSVRLTQGRDGLRRAIADALAKHPGEATQQIGERVRAFGTERDAFLKTEADKLRTQLGGHEVVANKAAAGEDNEALRRALLNDLTKTGAFATAMKAAKTFWAEQGRAHDQLSAHLAEEMAVYVEVPRDARRQLANLFGEGGKADAVRERILIAVRDLPGESTEVPALVSDIARQLESWRQEAAQKLLDGVATAGVAVSSGAQDELRLAIENGDYSAGWEAFVGEQLLTAPEAAPKAQAIDDFSARWDEFKGESNARLLEGLGEVVEMSPDLQDAIEELLHQPQEKSSALEGAILSELASEAVSRHLEPLLTEENAGAFTEELKTRLPLAKGTKNALRATEFTGRSSEQLQRSLVRVLERSFAAMPIEDFKRAVRNLGWLVEKDEKRRTAALTDMGTLVAEREAGRPVFTDPEGFLDTLQAGEILTDEEAAIVRRAEIETPDAGLSEVIDRSLRLPAERRRRLSESKYQEIAPILDQSIKGHSLFQREVNYVLDTNAETGKREIVIVDEFTGRKMPGRRYSEGLHEALEAKHGLEVQLESQTVATITIQNYFRLYHKLAGMTGTAKTEEQEFAKTYGIEVVAIPTNRKVSRQDFPDVVFKTNEAKMRAVTFEVLEHHCAGQPVLTGTRSVEVSERLSERLKAPALQALVLSHLCKEQLRNDKTIADDQRAGMLEVLRAPLVNPTPEEAHHLKSDGRRAEAASLMQIKSIAKMLNVQPDATSDENVDALLSQFTIPNASRERLQTALRVGLPHNVLNAKNHRNEARIIAEAARPAAVTIATNMAGRGVDILLGGSLDVESRWRVMTLQTLARQLEGKPVHVRARNQDATDKFLDRLSPERLQLLAWVTACSETVDELLHQGALQGQGVKEIREILGAELTTPDLQTKVRSRARRLNLLDKLPLDADPLKDAAPVEALAREIERLTQLKFDGGAIRAVLQTGVAAQTSGRDPVEGALLAALSMPLSFAWRATESLIEVLPNLEDLDRKLLNAVVSQNTTDVHQLAEACEFVTPDWVTQRLGELQVTDAATAGASLVSLPSDEVEVSEWQIAAQMGEAFMGSQWLRQRFGDWSAVGREARAYDAPEQLAQALGDSALVHFRLLKPRAQELQKQWQSGGDARRDMVLVEAPNMLMLNDLAQIVGPQAPFLEPQWLHYALTSMNIIDEAQDVAQAQMMGMAQDEQGQTQEVPVDVLVYRVRLNLVLNRLEPVFRELATQGADIKQARKTLLAEAPWAEQFIDESWIMAHLRAAKSQDAPVATGESQVFVETGVAGQSADIVLESEPRPEDVAHTSEQEAVKELGGLHIIGTERHESRRIDNQLRGRAGRQGDPGSSRFYASLEDELWRLFGVRNQWLLNQWDEDEAVEAKLISKSIERAQKKVELNHFESRKHVLQYDDVMNVQREVIYRERRRALMGGDVRDTTLDMAQQAAIAELEKHCPRDVRPEEWDTHRAYVELAKLFGAANLSKHLKADDLQGLHWNAVSEVLGQARYDADLQNGRSIYAVVQEMYEERETAFGAEHLREVERWAVTRAIDEHWMEHLAEMDYLRDAIWQESYAQKEPIGVFRQEGFGLFQKMLGEVRRQTTEGIFGADAGDNFALGEDMPELFDMQEARLLESGEFDSEGYDDGVQLFKDADGDDRFEPELRDGFAPALVSANINDESDLEPESAPTSPVVPQRSVSLANPTLPTTAATPPASRPQNGNGGNGGGNRDARRKGKKKR